LAVGVGILAGTSGWTRSRIALSVSAILICTQLIMLIFPVVHPNKEPVDLGFINGALPWRTMSRFDQWDWRPVLNLADRCGADTPAISFFGGGRNLNPPQIQFPWVVRATSTRAMKLAIPNVTWLWRSEEGSVDWQAVMDLAHQSDMVITAPRFVGEVKGMEDPDNLHNAEFEARLAKDPGFQGPFRFEMGRFQPIDVDVFVKKSLSCH